MGVGRHHDAGTRLYLEKEGRTDSEGNGGGGLGWVARCRDG